MSRVRGATVQKESNLGRESRKRILYKWGKLITSDLSDIICRTNCRAAAGGNGELKV